MIGHFGLNASPIKPGEIFFHRRREQSSVRNFAQVLGDEPDRLVGCHPVQPIESRQINRTRIGPQSTLESQIEVDIEVAHREFA